MSSVSISVIMPVYNSERYIIASIDSVLRQDYAKFELIIVDDGSTDSTYGIIKEYSNAMSNVKILRQTNSGPGKARLLGVKNASGDIVMFLDSDDILERGALSKIADVFKKEQIDILRFQSKTLHGNKYVQKMDCSKDTLSRKKISEYLFLTDKLSSMGLQAYQKQCFDGIDIPKKLIFAEDYLINLSIHNRQWKIAVIDDVLVRYRENTSSTTKTADKYKLIKNLEDRVYVCQRTVEFLDKESALQNTALARGLQIEKIRRDIAKLFAVYGEKAVDDVEKVLKSKIFSKLRGEIKESDIIEYADNEDFVNRLRNVKIRPSTKRIVSAIYHCDMGHIRRYAKNYRRAIKILGAIK